MNESIFYACLPWALCVVVAVVVARVLIWASGAHLRVVRVRTLHRCEEGSVQSLSFVLTLPFFVMILMLIVQASHIMIGNIVVQYSAFAAVRAASVWIPSILDDEGANQIASFSQIETDSDGVRYRVALDPSSPKSRRIETAAVNACLPLGPSRNLGYSIPSQWDATRTAMVNLYEGLDAQANNNSLFENRVTNKLAYSIQNTEVDLTFWHRRNYDNRYKEPPLQTEYFYQVPIEYNELGWQDHLTAEVFYNLPLLPGPVRLFARQARTDNNNRPNTDASGESYIWRLSAQATMGNEGEKSRLYLPHEERY